MSDTAPFNFVFSLSERDAEKFLSIFNVVLDKINCKINELDYSVAFDPGYDGEPIIKALEKEKLYFRELRDKVARGIQIPCNMDTIADTIFAKSHFYDILKRQYFEHEIDEAWEKNLITSDTNTNPSGTRVIMFTDRSFLIVVNNKYVLYKNIGYNFSDN